ncbi:hypothetical protein COLO4_06794 [Corchorus olitorius]|uniref:Uncharacterized protein n=1 Tax=Corchorus olitorius TaxID=93759 RepID=A0A1R3KLX2_9ROSI|nr:hypothetical protein COLO4_06794 [Corchorus olitorius]
MVPLARFLTKNILWPSANQKPRTFEASTMNEPWMLDFRRSHRRNGLKLSVVGEEMRIKGVACQLRYLLLILFPTTRLRFLVLG